METNLGIPGDVRLQSIVDAAERGERCPDIYVLVGGWIIQGAPISTAEFIQITGNDLFGQVAGTRAAQKLSKEPAERDRLINNHIAPFMATLGGPNGQDGKTLSLRGPAISGNSGPMIHTPALRVPLGAVHAWSPTRFTVDQTRTYSGGVAVGFVF